MPTSFKAGLQLVLILPAALFMTALVARDFGVPQSEPVRAAQLIVAFYSQHMWTLWVLLLGLPFVALIVGCVTMFGRREVELPSTVGRSLTSINLQPVTLLVIATTLTSAAILTTVVLQMLAN